MNFWLKAFSRLALAASAVSISVLANAAQQKKDCFGFDAIDDDPLAARLYEVQPGDKVEFQCPERSVFCKKGAFLLPGDQVVVSRVDGDKACAEYHSPAKRADDDETAGWLPLNRLVQKSLSPHWVGRWGDGDTTITAKPQSDKIRIDAKADLQFGNGREGGQFAALIDGTQPQAQFGYEPGDAGKSEKLLPYKDQSVPGLCRVKMSQLGRYLVVGDNRMCGGINVSFSRIYRRVDEKASSDLEQARTSKQSASGDATNDYGIRPSYLACAGKAGGITVLMRDCVNAEYKYQDERLNSVYRTLLATLGKGAATHLRDEQRAWIGQRDNQCEADKAGGTAELINAVDCAALATAERAWQLESRLSR
ncbi:lysozyme inhibitor LprI family protein [Rhizobium tropici]|nr:lysozyme inhibitor LprI family protein [Rhizobium tropici]